MYRRSKWRMRALSLSLNCFSSVATGSVIDLNFVDSISATRFSHHCF